MTKADIENHLRLPHFLGEHVNEGVGSYGPFGFLNPTGRRSTFSLKLKQRIEGQNHERDESEEERASGGAATNGERNGNGQHIKAKKEEEEIRAEDVQRLYRTRDNRKGKFLPRIHSSLLSLRK